jgi:hypothetical protein
MVTESGGSSEGSFFKQLVLLLSVYVTTRVASLEQSPTACEKSPDSHEQSLYEQKSYPSALLLHSMLHTRL